MFNIQLTLQTLRIAILITIAYIIANITLIYYMMPQGNSDPVWSLGVIVIIIILLYYIYMFSLMHSILNNLFDNQSFKPFFWANLVITTLCVLATIADHREALAITSLLLLLSGIIIFAKFMTIYKSDMIFLLYGLLGITSMIFFMVLSHKGMMFLGSIIPYSVNLCTILILLKAMKILRHGKK